MSRTKNEWTQPTARQTAAVQQTVVQQLDSMKRSYDRRHFEVTKYDIGEVVAILRQRTPNQS